MYVDHGGVEENAPSPRRGRKPIPPVREGDVQGGKYVAQIMHLLAPLRDPEADPRRTLHYDQLCAWLLLYFFTPILTSMRGLQQASDLHRMKRKLGLARFSLGSFSEATHLFDPQLLVPIMEQLAAQTPDPSAPEALGIGSLRPTAIDATLLHALPSMAWALWLDPQRRAAKLHLQLDLINGLPLQPVLGSANKSETRTVQNHLGEGRLYIGDRGYFDYDLMAAILKANSSFVLRVRDNVGYRVVSHNEPQDPKAEHGTVQLDAVVLVGDPSHPARIERPLRLIRLRVPVSTPRPRAGRKPLDSKTKAYREQPTHHTITLLSDQMDLEASHLAMLYRYRWQIELFFRWFKKVLQADRLLALSQNGLTIVVYCALIASMLIVRWTGRKPTKRTFEMLCLFFCGWAREEELLQHLDRLERLDPKKT